ncbi:MAG TPA: pyrroloquinoline quinone-dependent dehydrogenase [Vicinamibacterales bacterium]|nr:pyrroloquinoline quinone-dependent dehydrogenase [Vicinamibacterales bacterium]
MSKALTTVVAGVVFSTAVTVAIVAQRQPEPSPASSEWRFYAADAASTKYSPVSQITRANVKDLQIAWRWSSSDNAIVKANPTSRPGGYQDTPIMVNGVLYTTTSLGVYAAIDPGTGKTLWQYDPEIWKAGRPPNLGWTHRGAAYWSDGTSKRIISGTHDAHLVSIDAETGKPDPAFGEGGRVDVIAGLPYAERIRNYAINSTPVVVKNVVIAGSNITDGPQVKEQPRGDVFGFDVKTGKKLWTFHSVPQKGEFGYETWEDGAAEYTGNTNVWSMLTVDEQLGYVYLPFGTPTNDYYGGHRPGNNLFAESLVCLDATTGKRVWHFQAVHHGLWDYDFPAAPILVDITVNGRRINAVAQVSKQGFVYVFDRKTGQPVWPIEERPVPQSTAPGEKTSPTQPFPTKPPAFDRQGLQDADVIDFTPELRAQALEVLKAWDRGPLFTPPSEKGAVQLPGNVGGADWGGAAVDPQSGMLYVVSLTSPIIDQLVKGDTGQGNMRFRRGGPGNLPTLDGLPLYKPPYSRVSAIDLNSGTVAWQAPIGDGPRNHPLLKDLNLGPLGNGVRGAPLVTSTLLFVSQYQGGLGRGTALKVGDRELTTLPPEAQKFRAYDKKSGDLVWEYEMPGPAASPMTYMAGGKQYVVLAVGGGNNAELIAFALK